MLCPIRCGNSNRADLIAIQSSLLQSMGSAFTNEPLSNIWIWSVAFSRAIYVIWAINTNSSNQFNPQSIDTTLTRWLAIFNIQPLPTDTLETLRNKIQSKFSLLNQIPSNSNVRQLMETLVPQIFQELILTPNDEAYAGVYPAPPIEVVGLGPNTIGNVPWFSTVANIYFDLHKPAYMTQYTFWQEAYTIFPQMNQYLPCWSVFDWFSNSFSMAGTLTLTSGSVDGYGTGTSWNTPLSDGYYTMEANVIMEYIDDDGNWQRVLIAGVDSNTHLVLAEPAPSNATNQFYWLQGFYADCDSSSFPYPPTCFNCDNAGITNEPHNYV